MAERLTHTTAQVPAAIVSATSPGEKALRGLPIFFFRKSSHTCRYQNLAQVTCSSKYGWHTHGTRLLATSSHNIM